MTQTIPLGAFVSQRLSVALEDQLYQIVIRTLGEKGLFFSLYRNGDPVILNVACYDRTWLVRSRYLGMDGDFLFIDMQGTQDPEINGLGSRYILTYFTLDEITEKMLNETLKQRRLEVEFILGPDRKTHIQKVFNGLGNTLCLKGYRITATVESTGGDSGCSATVRVYNISMQDMNILSTFGAPEGSVNNTKMCLYAGNVGEGPMSLVYEGYITEAYVDMNTAPDISLYVASNTAGLIKVMDHPSPPPPFSYRGEIAVTTVMQQLAQKASLHFNGNGVNTILRNPYLHGSLYDQIKKCAKTAHVEWIIEKGELAIWPSEGGFRKSNLTEISSLTGMKGYPSIKQNNIHLTTLLNPNLIFYQNIQVNSRYIGRSKWRVDDQQAQSCNA